MVVSPGPINTPLVSRQSADVIARIVATIPMGRIGKPDEVAKVALFLASYSSRFVTGIELFVEQEVLAVSERQLVNAVERVVADGKHELAASLLESTASRFEQNPSVASARRLVYRKLMERNQNFDPFKFIIYSGRIGEQTPTMAIEAAGPKAKN